MHVLELVPHSGHMDSSLSERVCITWILDGCPQLTEDGPPKHSPQEHIEHIPEEEELADAAV